MPKFSVLQLFGIEPGVLVKIAWLMGGLLKRYLQTSIFS